MLPRQLSGKKSRPLRNLLVTAIFIASALCIYNILSIYPAFTNLMVEYTQNDAVRVSHYLSHTMTMPTKPLTANSPNDPLLLKIHQIEKLLELVGLKIYSPTGLTLYSTVSSEIGSINSSPYFSKLAAQGTEQLKIVGRDSYSLEGVKLEADAIEAYAPIFFSDGSFGGVVEIYYDISRRQARMDKLAIHSTIVLTAIIAGMASIALLLFVREKKELRERKLDHQAIDESREQLRTLLDSIPDLIILTDSEGQVIWVNQRAEKFFHLQLAPGESLKKTDIHSVDWLPEKLRPCFKDRIPREAEITLYTPSEQRLSFSCTLNPVYLQHSESPQLMLLLYRDITDKKSLQAETVRAGQLAAIGELAAGVAHEINNPINGIINCARILQDKEDLPAPVPDVSRRISLASDRIATIVRSLLSFARPDTGGESTLLIEEIIQDSLDLTSVQLQRERINFTFDVSEDVPKVRVLPNQIQQVVLNLISNSRHAVKKRYPGVDDRGCIRLEVKTSQVEGQGKMVILTFADNGIGIPADIKDQICSPFFTTKPAGEGTGLGLSISQSIIEKHRGQITFGESEDWPTLVTVSLPAAKEEPA